MKGKPQMMLVCGPNGAGKSTMTYIAIRKTEKILFIDPDRVAKDKQCSPIEAGKIVSRTSKELISNGQPFVKESTLTSNFDFQLIRAAKESGFFVFLTYVGLKSADVAVHRVKERHSRGGHTVPEEDIRRRYARSLEKLPDAILLVDKARIVDNSTRNYKEVAVFEQGKLVKEYYTPDWFQSARNIVFARSIAHHSHDEKHTYEFTR